MAKKKQIQVEISSSCYEDTYFGFNLAFVLRFIVKKERFGGLCPQEDFSNKISSNESLVWQHEECVLCKEHCAVPSTDPEQEKKNNIINWPEITYPGNDPKCIGYCPCKN